jgi:hypothetical protein
VKDARFPLTPLTRKLLLSIWKTLFLCLQFWQQNSPSASSLLAFQTQTNLKPIDYVKRAKSDPTGETPLSFTGSELTFGYDLIVFFKFENEEKAGEFQAKYAEQQEKIAADVAGFVQLEKFRVIAFEEGIST